MNKRFYIAAFACITLLAAGTALAADRTELAGMSQGVASAKHIANQMSPAGFEVEFNGDFKAEVTPQVLTRKPGNLTASKARVKSADASQNMCVEDSLLSTFFGWFSLGDPEALSCTSQH